MLFDTDVFIWMQKGSRAAARAIDGAPKRFVSLQSYLEFLQGAQSARQMTFNKAFFSDLRFVTLPLTEAVGHRAAIYIEQYALSNGLRAGDALIAATACEHNLPLLTANAKHFRAIPGLDLKIFKP